VAVGPLEQCDVDKKCVWGDLSCVGVERKVLRKGPRFLKNINESLYIS